MLCFIALVLLGFQGVRAKGLVPPIPDVVRTTPEPHESPKSRCSKGDYDMRIDLSSGLVEGSQSQITWQSALSGVDGSCAKQGVLKLNFGAPGTSNRKNKVKIDMWLKDPSEWVFNVGDSSTNNGASGDGGTTSRDAELQGRTATFSVFDNDYGPATNSGLINKNGVIKDRFSIIIADGTVIWHNYADEFDFLYDPNLLFALNGQSDKEGRTPNYDIYLAMNRVIGGSFRYGKGLCSVEITWLD